MPGHGDSDLTRLERMERRLPALEDAKATRGPMTSRSICASLHNILFRKGPLA